MAEKSFGLKQINMIGVGTPAIESSDDLIIKTNSSERVRIDSSGNIGIGTDNPEPYGPSVHIAGVDPALLIEETESAVDYFCVNVSNGNVNMWYDDSADIVLKTATAFGGQGSVERVRINSSGYVGIGLTNPDTELHIKTNSATGPTIRLEGTAPMGADDLIGGIDFFNIDGSGNGPQVGVSLRAYTEGAGGNGGYLIVGVQDSTTGSEGADTQEAFRVTTAGNIAFPSGQGIDFSATTDATGMTSELLDDYEEGTFTPEFATSAGSTANISSQPATRIGNYTKIGNRVLFNIWINGNMTTTETTNAIIIQGLPIDASAGNKGYSAVVSWNFSGFNTYKDEIILRSQPSSDEIILQRNGTNLTFDDIVKTGINFMVSGQYISA